MTSSCLIPPPLGRTQRVHVGDGEKPSLQEHMGMSACSDIFAAILTVIRQTCTEHGMDLNVPYRRQSPPVLCAVIKELLAKLPVLREYQDGWPIKYYLVRELKSHRAGPTHKPNAAHYSIGRRRSQTPFVTRLQRQLSTRTTSHVLQSKPRSIKGALRVPSRNESRSVSNIRKVTTAPASVAPSSTSSLGPIFDLLTSAFMPAADARRLVSLLASKGIKDLAYLKVLARMSTRDSWLEELVREETVTEIQMRVLQEILEVQL